LLAFLFGLMTLACKSNSNTENQAPVPADDLPTLEAQVLAIHDEIMPKMTDINTINAQLRAYKKNLQETQEGKIVAPEGLEETIAALKLAEQGMWDWMKQYNDVKATLREDQLKTFYTEQLGLVTKVKTDMLSAMENAQAWIAAHPNQ
jgi:hypothetical protein